MLTATLRGLLLAAATAIITLAQVNLPNEGYWDDRPAWLYGATGILALLALSDMVRNAINSFQADAVRAYEREIRGHLSEALLAIKDRFPQTDLLKVGVHAFRVRGLPPFRRLVNVGGLRLGTYPTMTDPRWRKGKGVVGQAWRSRMSTTVDWEEVFAEADRRGPEQWRKRNKAERFGLTWGELQLTSEYRRVCAQPIYAPGGKLVGCIAIDTVLPAEQARGPLMRAIMDKLTKEVGDMQRPPQAWWGRAT